MTRVVELKNVVALLALSLTLIAAGCADQEAPPVATDGGTTDEMPETELGDDDPLAALSTEDRKIAEEQKICPVGGAPLGSMGTPEKVMVKDQPVFICCAHCEDELLAHPDKYLAKIAEARNGGSEEGGEASEATPAPDAGAETETDDSTDS